LTASNFFSEIRMVQLAYIRRYEHITTISWKPTLVIN